jgi:hypothetical protein
MPRETLIASKISQSMFPWKMIRWRISDSISELPFDGMDYGFGPPFGWFAENILERAFNQWERDQPY